MEARTIAAPMRLSWGDSPAELRRLSYLSLFWLAARECLRVGRLWSQTVVAPVVSSLLFVIVFGLSLGGRIRHVSGFDYSVFILPGLVAMAMFMAAYMNNSSSIFQARSDRYIDDILAAPMRPWQIDIGLTVGGLFRALHTGRERRIARSRTALLGRIRCLA